MSDTTNPDSVADEGGPATLPPADAIASDATTTDAADASTNPDARARACSSDGWCETFLPEPLTFFRLAPVGASSAFALATAPSSQGALRVLLYENGTWSVLLTKIFATTVWAWSVDDVWVATTDGLLHGQRAGVTWTWKNESALYVTSVGGLSADDVYAVSDGRLYARSRPDGGTDGGSDAGSDAGSAWQVAFDPPQGADAWKPSLIGVAGASSNELWVVGARRGCSYAARRDHGVWRVLVDTAVLANAQGNVICEPGFLGAPVIAKPGEAIVAANQYYVDPITEAEGYAGSVVQVRALPDGGRSFPTARLLGLETPSPQVTTHGAELLVLQRALAKFSSFDAFVDGGPGVTVKTAIDGVIRQPTLVVGAPSNLWIAGENFAYQKLTP